MLSIDWLGLTASMTVDVVVGTVIHVEPSGIATISDIMDQKTVHIDIPEFMLDYFGPVCGPLMLERVLKIRDVILERDNG